MDADTANPRYEDYDRGQSFAKPDQDAEPDGHYTPNLDARTRLAQIKADEFLEWEEVYINNFYGTLKSEVDRIWAKGKHVIFDIDVAGGLRIKKKFPEKTLAVFVKPPDINELIIRLKQRGEESPEKIAMRVAKAPTEMATAPQFDTIILNDDLATALQNAENLVNDFLNK